MEKSEFRKAILKHIFPVNIPDVTYPAVSFHIVGNTFGLQTAAFQNAIDEISVGGGGHLIVPGGVYHVGALRLRSKVDLHLEKGAILRFTTDDPEKNYPLVYSHWEASPCWNYSALLYALDSEDISISGPGILDGCADRNRWWNWHHQVENAWSENLNDLQLNDRSMLREMNLAAVPIEQRVFGSGHYLRPNFIQFIRCNRIHFCDFTITNSPMWQINPVFCSSVTVERVTFSSYGPNNDGCDPESCNGVWIRKCRFDTGDDCISLKSGRDLDGRTANAPCKNILIEENEFADGHGGIALGSEMSGGIYKVLADKNYFSSPNLTYALRMKTNARRGGCIREIMLCNSVIDHVRGAAIHGTMLYEDVRKGTILPVFQDIVIEGLKARGGDYGIFMEAFPEVPIRGLVLRDIEIDEVEQEFRIINCSDPILERVLINGKKFPRPSRVRILGIPCYGSELIAHAESCTGTEKFQYLWQVSSDRKKWKDAGEGNKMVTPAAGWVRLRAMDSDGNREYSRPYRVLVNTDREDCVRMRLACRNLVGEACRLPGDRLVTRRQAAEMLYGMGERSGSRPVIPADTRNPACIRAASNGYFALDEKGHFRPEDRFNRQELATVAMQCCGLHYKNASTTMPDCRDKENVWNSFGTDVARSIYFGFLELEDGYFYPMREVTAQELCQTLVRVADFAGL